MSTDRLKTFRNILCAMTVTAMFIATQASAQQDFGGPTDADLDVQNFEPTPSPYGIFNVDASQTSADLQVSGGLILHYDKDPLVLVPAGSDKEIAIIENQVVAEALFALGLSDFLELGIALPIYLLNSATIDQQTIEGATIGDLRLRPKVTAVSSEDNPVGLAFVLHLSLPTGDTEAFTSSGNVTARPGVVIDTKIDRLLLAANLGADLQSTRGFGNLEVGSELVFGAGAQYEIVENRFLLGAELYGSTSFDDFFKSEVTPLEGLVGLKYRTDFGLNLETGIGRGIIAGYGAPEIRVFGGLRYAEYDPDWDKDGILNSADNCPRTPEDKDQFEDEDGCPDPDNDQDGILDMDDSCPNEPEDRDDFEDEDGCPDPDNDQDGTLDVDDACPLVPGPKETKGCPITDRDGDRIPDDVDKCPDNPEDYDSFEDEDGCPDLDNDKDGILDVNDKCPLNPEDKDGFEDQDGCPDPDNDRDGILDTDDKCPDRPETYNQFEDEDGCPDKNIIVEKGEIKILERVYFQTNSAKLAGRSKPLLRDVATVLENYPGIKRVEIQGHTDDRASDAYNLTLSEARAKSVFEFLTAECGVPTKRLRPKGYGETVPAESIDGKSGRALARARDKNRRVQFIILEQVEENRGKVKTK